MTETKKRQPWRYTPEHLEQIRRMYWDEGQSIKMISRSLGIQEEPLRVALKRHGFATRDLSEAARLRQVRERKAS